MKTNNISTAEFASKFELKEQFVNLLDLNEKEFPGQTFSRDDIEILYSDILIGKTIKMKIIALNKTVEKTITIEKILTNTLKASTVQIKSGTNPYFFIRKQPDNISSLTIEQILKGKLVEVKLNYNLR